MTIPVAIIGSGNIGTDLLLKVEGSAVLDVVAMAGIDPGSDGLACARARGVQTTAEGVEGLTALPEFANVRMVFDATSAAAHEGNVAVLAGHDVNVIDLTPAALGPYVVPSVNLGEHSEARDINMVTCGGQATVPMVAALSRVAPVAYAEIVASIASRSAGPGTRANIDEFTQTTAAAVCRVGGAGRGKAVIVLNPADPPVMMRNTVYGLLPPDVDLDAVAASVHAMAEDVRGYVPGYRLTQDLQFDRVATPYAPALEAPFQGVQVTVLLEIAGAGDYLPPYAGNLDIMTAAAIRTAERLAEAPARTVTP